MAAVLTCALSVLGAGAEVDYLEQFGASSVSVHTVTTPPRGALTVVQAKRPRQGCWVPPALSLQPFSAGPRSQWRPVPGSPRSDISAPCCSGSAVPWRLLAAGCHLPAHGSLRTRRSVRDHGDPADLHTPSV